MSIARVLRFLAGTLTAAILLGIVLPVVGVPSSRFLPPGHIYAVAKGYTRGEITDKFYTESGNPFTVGARSYHVDYAFNAKAPVGNGQAPTAKMTLYYGQVVVDKNEYDAVLLPKNDRTAEAAKSNEKIGVVPGQNVRVKYEVSAPDINGVEALLVNSQWVAWGGRSTLGAAGSFSGWLGWIVVALALGYGIMLILERFGGRENI